MGHLLALQCNPGQQREVNKCRGPGKTEPIWKAQTKARSRKRRLFSCLIRTPTYVHVTFGTGTLSSFSIYGAIINATT